MNIIKQNHSGTGDNIVGDKTSSLKQELKSNLSIPLWLQWVVAIATVFGVIWAVYVYFF